MDLDLISMAWEWPLPLQVDLAVAEELTPVYGEEFAKGRLKFWKMFLDRGFVFRSKRFRGDPNLEPVAIQTVQRMVDSLSG